MMAEIMDVMRHTLWKWKKAFKRNGLNASHRKSECVKSWHKMGKEMNKINPRYGSACGFRVKLVCGDFSNDKVE